MLDGKKGNDVRPGQLVEIIQKHHQRSGELTAGVVKRKLTKVAHHTRGIKVQLETGEVGRVQHILEDSGTF